MSSPLKPPQKPRPNQSPALKPNKPPKPNAQAAQNKEKEEQERLEKQKELERQQNEEAERLRQEHEAKNTDEGSSNKTSESEDEGSFDKPIEIHEYKSKTIEETLKDIESQRVETKPLTKLRFIKKRREFSLLKKFNESDATDHYTEIKQIPDPLFHANKKIIDIGLQGCNPLVKNSTQTTWFRKVNRAEQVIFEENFLSVEDDDTGLLAFLQNVYPLMEEALQSNETIDIFQDDFNVLPEEDLAMESTDMTNQIKEYKSFSNLQCEGKKITCIQFQPSGTNPRGKFIVAESFIENLSFDDRAVLAVKSYKSMIMFWDFEDIHSIEPILILSSPLEILCFDFNPKDPNIVVAGAINGQVLMWNLGGATSSTSLSAKKVQKAKQERNSVPVINPLIMSTLQDPAGAALASSEVIKKNVNSHKNPVLALKWIPNSIEIDRKFNVNPNATGDFNQFTTISEDGQILIWDLRFGEKDPKKNSEYALTVSWKAMFGVQLFRPEGGGKMGGSHICFQKYQKNSVFAGTSDEGELFLLDFSVKTSEESTKSDMVTKMWQYERGYRPTVSLDRSPFFEDIVLTVHDFHFSIWRLDIDVPIFSSCLLKNAQFTCGAFSPYRPGIIIVGRNDGWLDIWDFLDQSHKCTLQYNVVTYGISFIRFHDAMHTILGVGDENGTLHILELPYTLWKKIGNEEQTMREYWDREVARVEYFKKRFEIRDQMAALEKENREKELAKKEKEKEKESEKKEDDDDTLNNEYLKFCEEYIKTNIEKTAEKDVKKKEDKDFLRKPPAFKP